MFEYESWLYVYAALEGDVLLYGVCDNETGSPLLAGNVGEGVFGPFDEDAVV
jgi:hypothetical protein